MKSKVLVWALTLGLGTMACGSDQQEIADDQASAVSSDAKVEPSSYLENPAAAGEMTYEQLEAEVFAGTGQPAEWNGRPMNEGRDFLSMSVGGQCGEGNCGKQIQLVNSHETSAIRAVVTIPFQVEGSPGYIAREYSIPAGTKTYIGCTHLCSGAESTEFKRAIVVAELQ